MITHTNAAETAIAWAATNKSTCTIAKRIIPWKHMAIDILRLESIAQKNNVTINITEHEYHFTHIPETNPPTEL